MSSEMRGFDVLEVARETGLRSHLHGVNATDARAILERFASALLARTEAGADGDDLAKRLEHAADYEGESGGWDETIALLREAANRVRTHPQDASGDAVKPLMAARETEDDGAAIMGRLARALAKADPSSKLPRRAIDWLRSKGIHWKSHCPTDPLHNFDEPLTGAGDNDDLPAFLEWVAGEVVRRDTRAGNFAEGLAQSLRGRAHILRIVKNDAMQAKEAK